MNTETMITTMFVIMIFCLPYFAWRIGSAEAQLDEILKRLKEKKE